MPSISRQLRRFIKSEGILLFTAILTPVLLKRQVLDAYVVSTPSMEPTIEGDPTQGDRVLVDKLWDNLCNPKRFHLIVFQHESKMVVKRIVGLPKEWIKISDFDLWVGKEASSLKRIEKSPSKDKDMFAIYWDSNKKKKGVKFNGWRLSSFARKQTNSLILDGGGIEEEALFAEASRIHPKDKPMNHQAWHMRFLSTITTGYIDGFGNLKQPYGGNAAAAKDFGIQGTFKFDPNSKLWFLYRYIGTPFIIILGKGQVRIWKNGKLLFESRQIRELFSSTLMELTLVFLDGRFCLSINRHDVWEFKPKQSPPPRSALKVSPGNDIMLAASGGKIAINSLKIIHDFHYLDIGKYGAWSPTRIQSDHYFVLGDNSQDSQDSRHFGPIPRSRIKGRPLMVAAPNYRVHFFPR